MEEPRYLRFARAIALVTTTAAIGAWVGCERRPATVARDPDDKAKDDAGTTVVTPTPRPVRSGACSFDRYVGVSGTGAAGIEKVTVPCAEGSRCAFVGSEPSCLPSASSVEEAAPCGPIQCEYRTCVDAMPAGACA